MGGEVLDGAQAAAVLADQRARSGIGDPLIGDGLDELAHPQAARVAGRALGGQRVVGADDLVAVGDVGHRPEEQGAVVGQVGEEEVVVAGHDLNVLEGQVVGQGQHLGVVVAHDHAAVVGPRLGGDVGRGQGLELGLDLGEGVEAQLARRGEQDRGRSGAVLGLTQQVGGADFAVDRVVGQEQGFGGPGRQVDADPPVQLALGLGHVGVAGPHQHVDGVDELRAERQRRHRLDPAQQIDLVGAGEVHRRDRLGRHGTVDGRSAGGDPGHPGHLGGQHAHMGRRHHRVATAGHVRPDGRHGDVPVPERDAGKRLDLEVVQRFELGLGEVPYLGLGEPDVVDGRRIDPGDDLLDLVPRQLEPVRLPVVEVGRHLADGGLAPGFDSRDQPADSFGQLPVGAVGPFGGGVLEYLSHCLSASSCPRGACRARSARAALRPRRRRR